MGVQNLCAEIVGGFGREAVTAASYAWPVQREGCNKRSALRHKLAGGVMMCVC